MNNIQDIFLDFYNTVKSYNHLGTRETKYANLIAKAPHLGKQAWLHAIYKPISQTEIDRLNGDLSVKLPRVYENFLKVCNGLSVFGTTLSLFGYRYNYIRDLENVWQPFDLVKTNNREKPHDAQDNHFFFGFYNWDGSKLYFDKDTMKVYRCSRESVKPLNEWANFENMLMSEINRLIKLFDDDGVEIDEFKETTPPVEALL